MLKISPEIIIKFLLIMYGIYFFNKLITPVLFEYFQKRFNKNKKNKSIDQMIREKELLLKTNFKQKNIDQGKNTTSQTNILSIDGLITRYKELEHQDNNHAREDIKKIIELFESLQWGNSPVANSIIKELNFKFGLDISDTYISKIIKQNYQSNFFQSLPSYTEISDYLSSTILILIILDSTKSQMISKSMSKTFLLIEEEQIIKGAHLYLLKNELGSHFGSTQIKNIISSNESPLYKKNEETKAKMIECTLFSLSKNHIISPSLIWEKIFNEALIIRAITPIKISSQPTREEALQLFQIQNKNSLDQQQIKKIYKKFALLCHPDKLSGQNIPKEFLDNANENFVKIKNAYDILRRD